MAEKNELNHAKTEQLMELMENSPLCVFVCDTQDRKLLYLNHNCAKLSGKSVCEAAGKTCYEYLKNRTEPCRPCYIDTATGELEPREYTSNDSGKHYQSFSRLIEWNGRPAFLEYLSDETENAAAGLSFEELINTLPGGVGLFDINADGSFIPVFLNDGYHALLNDTRSQRLRFMGKNAINAVHPDDRAIVAGTLQRLFEPEGETSCELRLITGYDSYKWINIRLKVSSLSGDGCRAYATFSDVDELKKARLSLEASHRTMEIASKSGSFSFWRYDLDSRTITQESDTSLLGYSVVIDDVPASLCGTGDIHTEDEAAYCAMYESLQLGAERSECTVRVLNHYTNKYEWQHMVCTRLYDSDCTDRMAVGISSNVDLQQQNLFQYEHELQLRRELVKTSVFSYQLNLTSHMVEEYQTLFSDDSGITAPTPANEALRTALLRNVYPDDRGAVRTTVFSDALLRAYSKGKTSVSLIYRRNLPGVGYRWVKTAASIMKRPFTGELIAFLHCQNIDAEKKDQLAIESIMDEEIESVAVLSAKSGMAHLVRVKKSIGGLEAHQPFNFDASMNAMIQSEVIQEDRAACKSFFYVSDLVKALETEPIVKLTFRVRDERGHIHRKKTRAFFLDDSHTDIVIIRRDITDLYAEEQRQKRALQKAVDAANSANRAKSEFLSRMSHDIRTPLTAILALSGRDMTAGADEAQKDAYLAKIHSSGEYLLGIINDVLDMSKIESNKMVLQLEPYSLSSFSSTISTVIGEQCHKKGINFIFSVPDNISEWIMVDKTRFNQVFINLLSNAVKFTPSGGSIKLLIECLSQNGRTLECRFTVSDTGIGMSPDFLPRAFDSFSQESRQISKEVNQGTGLGLSIVKQLVDLMGGSISVSSELDRGTTFTINLALESTEAPDAAPPVMAGSSSIAGLRILLCEDNSLNTEIVTSLLEMQQCTIKSAENGQLGLEAFLASTENFFDLILMDIRMPVLDGISTTRAIRALDRADAKTIPIIALTADAFSEDANVAYKAGMNGHLAKPIDPQKLYDEIARQAAKRSSLKKL